MITLDARHTFIADPWQTHIDRLSVLAYWNYLVLSKISSNIKAQFQQNLSSMFMESFKRIFEHDSGVFHVEILQL